MKKFLDILLKGDSLTRSQAFEVMNLLTEGRVSSDESRDCLLALNKKSESVEEIVGFVECLRSRATKLAVKNDDLMDVCGTGGDGAGTFNVSTAVSFVVAACGQGIAKHGNRSVSSRSGSFDVLEVMGIPHSSDQVSILDSLRRFDLCFLFAPAFHPAMKNVAPIRKALGVRTVFNILGPMLNPVLVKKQVMGVFSKGLLEKVALSFRELGSTEVMVVHGLDGLDEFSISGPTQVAHLKDGKIKFLTLSPDDFGLKKSSLTELKGGEPQVNAEIIIKILNGEKGPRQDIVLMNAAAALYVGGKVGSLKDGVNTARHAIESGMAHKLLTQMKAL